MKHVVVFVISLFAGLSYSSPDSRIVGGWPTSIERYPSIVQVDYFDPWAREWIQSCAANILTTRYVLTAAHCFSGWLFRIEDRRIRAGTTFRHIGGKVVYVEKEFNHPTYGALDADGDISVVRLASSLVMSPVVQRGRFIGPGIVVPDNLPVVHAGWGHTYANGISSPHLLETEVYTVNNAVCAARYLTLNRPLTVTENMICAGLLDVGGRDACQGDSGGPLYYNDGSGDIIVGIVSWGEGCGNATFPGVSTAVSPYIEWVVATAV